jgi:hypothetical protein
MSGARDAQFFGAQFEQWHEGQLNAAVMLGILAHWLHTEPKATVVHGRVQYAEKSGADWVGIMEAVRHPITVGGPDQIVSSSFETDRARVLVVETKSVKGNSLPRSMIEKKQAEHLDACARAGGLALLVGEFRLDTVRMRFACPWLEVPWEVKRSAESISPILMAPWDVSKFPDCYLKRWHAGGKRSGTWSALRKRVYNTE